MNTLLTSHGWQIAGWTMLHFLWIGTAIALVGMLLHRSLRPLSRERPGLRYATSLLTLAIFAVAPAGIAWHLSSQMKPTVALVEVEPQPSDPQSPAAALPAASENNMPDEPLVIDLAQTPIDTSPFEESVSEQVESIASVESHVEAVGYRRGTRHTKNTAQGMPRPSAVPYDLVSRLSSLATYLPWIWLVGAPLTFALLTTGLVGSEKLRRTAKPLSALGKSGDAIEQTLQRLAKTLDVSRKIAVGVSDSLAQPILIGIIRPMILLPSAALANCTPEELEMILLHELTHVRRWDNLVNFAQRIVESLLFFHPCVWWLSRQVRVDREQCVDAVVVGQTAKPQAYAELLVNFAAARNELPRTLAASAMARNPLAGRIRKILNLEDEPMLVSRRTLPLAGLAVAVVIGLVLWQPALKSVAKETKSKESVTEERVAQFSELSPESESNEQKNSTLGEAVSLATDDTDRTDDTERNRHRFNLKDELSLPPGNGHVIKSIVKHQEAQGYSVQVSRYDDGTIFITRRKPGKKTLYDKAKKFSSEATESEIQAYTKTFGEQYLFKKQVHDDGTFTLTPFTTENKKVARASSLSSEDEANEPKNSTQGEAASLATDETDRTDGGNADEADVVGGDADAIVQTYLKLLRSASQEQEVARSRYEKALRELENLKKFAGDKPSAAMRAQVALEEAKVEKEELLLSKATKLVKSAEKELEVAKKVAQNRKLWIESRREWGKQTAEAKVSWGDDTAVGGLSRESEAYEEKNRTRGEAAGLATDETDGTDEAVKESNQRDEILVSTKEWRSTGIVVTSLIPAELDYLTRRLTKQGYASRVNKEANTLEVKLAINEEPVLATSYVGNPPRMQRTVRIISADQLPQLKRQYDAHFRNDIKHYPPTVSYREVEREVMATISKDYKYSIKENEDGSITVRRRPKANQSNEQKTSTQSQAAGLTTDETDEDVTINEYIRDAESAVQVYQDKQLSILESQEDSFAGKQFYRIMRLRADGKKIGWQLQKDGSSKIVAVGDEPAEVLDVAGDKVCFLLWKAATTASHGNPRRAVTYRTTRKGLDELRSALTDLERMQIKLDWNANTNKTTLHLNAPEAAHFILRNEFPDAVLEDLSNATTYTWPETNQITIPKGNTRTLEGLIERAEQEGYEIYVRRNDDGSTTFSRVKKFPSTPASVTNSPFPTLEEQRAADLVYKLLNVEVEKLSEEELKRVKAKKFAGGLKVTSAHFPGQYGATKGPLQPGDLLVGLHVWPTTSLADIQTIFQRDDIDELSPLKFYVIRQEMRPTEKERKRQEEQARKNRSGYGGEYGAGEFGGEYGGPPEPEMEAVDVLITGRIEPNLEAWRTIQQRREAKQAQEEFKSAQEEFQSFENDPFSASSGGLGKRQKQAQQRGASQENQRTSIAQQYSAAEGEFRIMEATWQSLKRAVDEGRYRGDATKILEELQLKIDAKKSEMESLKDRLEIPGREPKKYAPTYLYAGKPFEHWRDLFKYELSTERRIEAIKALAAFGRTGKGEEAATAILDVAGEYEFHRPTQPEESLAEEIIQALSKDIDHRHWLPQLSKRFEEKPLEWDWLVHHLAREYRDKGQQATMAPLLKKLCLMNQSSRVEGARSLFLTSYASLDKDDTKQIVDHIIAQFQAEQRWQVLIPLQSYGPIAQHLTQLTRTDSEELTLAVRKLLSSSKGTHLASEVIELSLATLNDPKQEQHWLNAVRNIAATKSLKPDIYKTLSGKFRQEQSRQLNIAMFFAMNEGNYGNALQALQGSVLPNEVEPLKDDEAERLLRAEREAVFGKQR